MHAGYRDRRDGGRALKDSFARFSDDAEAILVALPRGGVPVAHEVARHLGLPLKLLLVRRLRLPGSELSVGSVGVGGAVVLSHDILALIKASRSDVDAAVERELKALAEAEARCSAPVSADDVRGRSVILIDDGIATGSSMSAAGQTVRAAGAARVIAAAPVASPMAIFALEPFVDRIVCPLVPDPFYTVGIWYEDFADVSDADVDALLKTRLPRTTGGRS